MSRKRSTTVGMSIEHNPLPRSEFFWLEICQDGYKTLTLYIFLKCKFTLAKNAPKKLWRKRNKFVFKNLFLDETVLHTVRKLNWGRTQKVQKTTKILFVNSTYCTYPNASLAIG